MLESIRTTAQHAEIDRSAGNLAAALVGWRAVIESFKAHRQDLKAAGKWTSELFAELAKSCLGCRTAHYLLGQRATALAEYDQAIALNETVRRVVEPGGHWFPQFAYELARIAHQ